MSVIKSGVKGLVKGGKKAIKGIKAGGEKVVKGVKKVISKIFGKSKQPTTKTFKEGDAIKLKEAVIKKPKKMTAPKTMPSGAERAKVLDPSLQLLMNAP